jgi:uncharacterized membrane protein YfcA
MHALLMKALIGTVVGALVGLTGLGSGVLLLPVLIFGLGIPPIIAVGSDAAFSVLTKLGAGVLHWHQRTVNWRLVRFLAVGSVPGAFGGVLLLAHWRAVYGDGVNSILKYVIGALLVFIPLLVFFQGMFRKPASTEIQLKSSSWIGTSLIGLFAGFVVGMSSVGSGTVVLVLLVLLIQCSPAVLVGTDIVHAVILTGFTSLLYLRLGTVDFSLVMALLVGSVPGALIGARLSARLPSPWLRRVLCVALLASGVKMLLV